ncbi:MAG: GGDEF domain-containing protein [Cyanobacteria bacterium P01_D01_bin.14]
MDAVFLTLALCMQSQQLRQLKSQFYTDSLTQVGNRAAFDESLVSAWNSYVERGQDFALLYIDGNNIKGVNDTYGHAAGDRVIVAISDSLRPYGQAFRLGGDEFALLLTDLAQLPDMDIKRLIQQIQHRIWQAGRELQTQLPIQSMLQGGQQLPLLSAAIGWALASRADNAVDLQMKADAAMYVNKWRGKRLGRYVRESLSRNQDAKPPVKGHRLAAPPHLRDLRAGERAAASVSGSTPSTVLR